MPNCTEVDPSTPPDILVWYVDEADNFHTGIGFNIGTAIRKTAEADALWEADKKSKRMSGAGQRTSTSGSSSTVVYNQHEESIFKRYSPTKYWRKMDHYVFCNQYRKDFEGTMDRFELGL